MTLAGTILAGTGRPQWLTFDCYGTLIQWDEGLKAAVARILAGLRADHTDPDRLIAVYDHHEHRLEQERPHRSFRGVAGEALRLALAELNLVDDPWAGQKAASILTAGISAMPPFAEVPDALGALKAAGYRLCVISNTDDDIIAGNIAQLGGHIDRVITAEQAQAYKPSPVIFDHAHRALGVDRGSVLHICASPHLDLVAARDLGFRCIWIDRGSGRKPLADYSPAAVLPSLDLVPPLLAEVWG